MNFIAVCSKKIPQKDFLSLKQLLKTKISINLIKERIKIIVEQHF
jgi:hypothetical protein